MKYRTFKYVEKFKCVADRCTDNCCIGWEIGIDENTWQRYEEMQGDIGEKIRANVDDGVFRMRENGRCPMLSESGLCEIICACTGDALCDICREHPRFYNYFGDLCEWGVGLCCEAAVPLILSGCGEYSEKEVADEVADEDDGYDVHAFDLLFAARERMFSFMRECDAPSLDKIDAVTEYAAALEGGYDAVDIPAPRRFSLKEGEFDDIKLRLGELEYMSVDWGKRIANATPCDKKYDMLRKFDKEITNLYVYFVYRYFLGCVFDGDPVGKLRFAREAVVAILSVAVTEYGDGLDLTKLYVVCKDYSKEIEYSEDNVFSMLN